MPIIARIDVAKIDKAKLFEGKPKNGHTPKYLELVFFDNRDGEDQYGNLGFVAEGVTKEEREQGVRGNILGNWKKTGGQPQQQQRRPEPPRGYQPPARKPVPPKDPDLDPNSDEDLPFNHEAHAPR